MTPVASSSSAGVKNSGQSHSFYDQQGPSDPSDYAQHHYTQANDIFQLRMFFFGHIIISNGSDNVVSQNIILIAGTLIHMSGHSPLPVIMTFNPMLACRRVCAYP